MVARQAVQVRPARVAWPLRAGWPLRQLPGLRPTREQRLLEMLERADEPLVAAWAHANRAGVRDSEQLLGALEELRAQATPEARSLAATIWLAWRNAD